MKPLATMLAFVAFLVNVATADVIVLVNGSRIEGDLYDVETIRENPTSLDAVRIERAANVVRIETDRIAYVVIGASKASGEVVIFEQAPSDGPGGYGLSDVSELSPAMLDTLSWFQCRDLGRRDGEALPTSGSFAGGLLGGVALGLIGTLLAVAVQGDPQPPTGALMALNSGDCRQSYTDAFRSQGKSKKRSAALRGGILGTVVFVAVYLVATSDE